MQGGRLTKNSDKTKHLNFKMITIMITKYHAGLFILSKELNIQALFHYFFVNSQKGGNKIWGNIYKNT
jgi:hypothetical protein